MTSAQGLTRLAISLIEKRLKDAFYDKAKQPGGLIEISRGWSEAKTPGCGSAIRERPGRGAGSSSTPAGVRAFADR